jgi:hypothetical protein
MFYGVVSMLFGAFLVPWRMAQKFCQQWVVHSSLKESWNMKKPASVLVPSALNGFMLWELFFLWSSSAYFWPKNTCTWFQVLNLDNCFKWVVWQIAAIRLLNSIQQDELRKLCGSSFPTWVSFPTFEKVANLSSYMLCTHVAYSIELVLLSWNLFQWVNRHNDKFFLILCVV